MKRKTKDAYNLLRRFGAAVFLAVVALCAYLTVGQAAYGATVVIEPGHRIDAEGAVNPLYGIKESEVNLAIGLKLNSLLQQAGYSTFMTRTGGTSVDGQPWIDMVNSSGGDLFVSIHANSNSGSPGSGTETYYAPDLVYRPGDSRDQQLATAVQTNLVSSICSYPYYTRDRGVKSANYYIRYLVMPAALAEVLFINNNVEALLLANESFQWKAAEGLFNAIVAVVPPGNPIQFPRFEWTAITGAVDYRIELMSDWPTNPNGTGLSGNNLGKGFTVSTFWLGDTRGLPSGTYYWRILALDSSGNPIGGSTDAQSFVVPKAILNSPFSGSELTTQFPVFRWDPVPSATGYGIELCAQEPTDNPNGKTASVYRMAVGVTGETLWNGDIRGLAVGTYYYRVIAWNSAGFITGFSDADSFTVPKPVINSVFNGALLTTQFPRFDWSMLTGATTYGLELLDAPPEPNEVNGTIASIHRIGVGVTSSSGWNGNVIGIKAGRYYYRVIAWNDAGFLGGFSDADSFTVPKPDLRAIDWSRGVNTPYFSWDPLIGADDYGIELLSQAPENQNGTTQSRYRVGAASTSHNNYYEGNTVGINGGTYYYRIIAWNENGYLGGFSDADSFDVVRPNLQPLTWNDPLHPYFSWTPVSGATEYEIEVLRVGIATTDPNGVARDPNGIAWGSTTATYYNGDITGWAPGLYCYRVRAMNGGATLGTYSCAGTFFIGLAQISVTSSGDAFNIVDQSGVVLTTVPVGGTAGVSYFGGTYSVVASNGYSAATSSYFRMVPVSSAGIIQVMNMPQYNRFRGVIEVRYSYVSNKLWAINELDMNSYMNGMGEEPESWPGSQPGRPEPPIGAAGYQEFLKLSAVAFRSYAYDVGEKKNKHQGEPFDLCNSPSSCQWYIGYERETYGGNLSSAVDQTYGQVLNYDRRCARVPYFSECGGATQSAASRGWYYPWCLGVSDADVCSGHTPSDSHHVGICMNGARWRAYYGWNYDQIAHYYLAVDAGFGNIGNPPVRIGVYSTNL